MRVRFCKSNYGQGSFELTIGHDELHAQMQVVLKLGGRYESYGCGRRRHGILLPPAFRSPVTGAASLACRDVVVFVPF